MAGTRNAATRRSSRQPSRLRTRAIMEPRGVGHRNPETTRKKPSGFFLRTQTKPYPLPITHYPLSRKKETLTRLQRRMLAMDEQREDRGFLKAGGLAMQIASSREALASTLKQYSPSSETTGEQLPARVRSSAIGQPRGATGAAALPALREALAALDSDKAGLALQALLRPLEKSSLKPMLSEDFEVVGYRLTGPIEAKALAQLEAITTSMTDRCGKEFVVKALVQCLTLTKSREKDGLDIKLMIAAMADRLAEFPADVVSTALRKWADRETWWPSLAEIREPCLREMRWRRSLKIALEEARQG